MSPTDAPAARPTPTLSLAPRVPGPVARAIAVAYAEFAQTGEEMSTKFKETSLGGLAVNLPEC